jgi:hypothetical protein
LFGNGSSAVTSDEYSEIRALLCRLLDIATVGAEDVTFSSAGRHEQRSVASAEARQVLNIRSFENHVAVGVWIE